MAVADNGSCIYIVGGTSPLDTPLEKESAYDTYVAGDSLAEVFELSLGDRPLEQAAGKGTARWRQVRH